MCGAMPPPRGLWCYGFEGFNRVIKAGAKRSNFKCESVSIMEYYASWKMTGGSLSSGRIVV